MINISIEEDGRQKISDSKDFKWCLIKEDVSRFKLDLILTILDLEDEYEKVISRDEPTKQIIDKYCNDCVSRIFNNCNNCDNSIDPPSKYESLKEIVEQARKEKEDEHNNH